MLKMKPAVHSERAYITTRVRGALSQKTVIFYYKKSQREALFLKFILTKVLYMFRTDVLSIIRSLNTVYTAIGTCHASTW